MKKFNSVMMLLLCLALVAPPAFCQEYGGGYADYHVPMPDDVNCSAQPANQYYNPGQQQQQFNQLVSPTQVPSQDSQYGAQSYDGADKQQASQTPQNMSAYQKQEAALEQSQMAQQLEEIKQRRESEESFRMTSEFNDKQPADDSSPSSKKNKAKSVASGMGRLMKGTMRYATPVVGTAASLFLLRAAFGNNVMMPVGGGMMVAPGAP